MNFAVLHYNKANPRSSVVRMGYHIDRSEKYKPPRWVNAEKSHLNVSLKPNKYCGLPLAEAIEERIKEGYKKRTAIRKDAVKYIYGVMTGSHEVMHEVFNNSEKKERWLQKNLKFLCDEFGKDNIVRYSLHLDEKTPHCHFIVVPLTKDGRLSAKAVIGNSKDMVNRQTRYGEAMAEFGLKRGIEGSKAVHTNPHWYYGRIKRKHEDLQREHPLSLSEKLNPIKRIQRLTETKNILIEEVVNLELRKERLMQQLNVSLTTKEKNSEHLARNARELKHTKHLVHIASLHLLGANISKEQKTALNNTIKKAYGDQIAQIGLEDGDLVAKDLDSAALTTKYQQLNSCLKRIYELTTGKKLVQEYLKNNPGCTVEAHFDDTTQQPPEKIDVEEVKTFANTLEKRQSLKDFTSRELSMLTRILNGSKEEDEQMTVRRKRRYLSTMS